MKIASVQLYAKNVEKLAAFYTQAFGLESVREEPGFVTLSDGDFFLSIHKSGKSARERGGEMTSITFAARDVEKSKTELATRGLKLGKVYEVDGFAFAKGRDPEGNHIHISNWVYRGEES